MVPRLSSLRPLKSGPPGPEPQGPAAPPKPASPRRPPRLDSRVYAAFAVALLLVVSLTVRTLFAVVAFERAGLAVRACHSGLYITQALLAAVHDAQRSLRGYVLTGRQEFATGIDEALGRARVENQRIAELTRGDADLQQRGARLSQQLEAFANHLRRQAQLEQAGRHADAVSSVQAGIGEGLHQSLLATVASIVQTERERLRQLEADADDLADDLELQVLAGGVAAFLLLSGSAWAVRADIDRRRRLQGERDRLIQELQQALAEVKTLSGLLPTCAWCRKVRDDQGYWTRLEAYVASHTGAQFSHGICPECEREMLRQLDDGGEPGARG